MEHETTLYLTWGIIGVIVVMTIYALLSRRPGVAHNAPSILTSLGIFGTFLGITIGLAGFNPDDVASSVTYLFGGIKLAFWTSVAGILGGILVKFRHLFLFPSDEGGRVTLDDLVKAMRGVEASLTDDQQSPLLASLRDIQAEARDQSQSHNETLQASLDAINKSVDAADQRDQAVLDQLKRMDGGSSAGFDKLAAATAAMGKDLSSELSERLSSSAEKSAATTAQNMQQVADAIKSLHAAMGDDASALLAKLDSVKSGSESLGDRLSAVLGDNQSAVADAIKSLHAAMGDDASALLAKLDSVKSGSESLGDRLSAVLGDNQSAIADAIQRLQGVMSGDTAQMLERMEAMRHGSEALGERLSEVLGANNQALADAMQGNRDALAAQIATAVTELRDALVGPDGAATALSGSLQQGQMELAKALARVSENLQGAVDRDLATLNSNLAASGEQTAKHMQQVADSIAALQTAMGGDTSSLLDKLDTLRAGSDGLGERLSEVLGANNQALAEAMQGNRDALAAQIATAVTELRDALVGPDGAAQALSGTMQQGQLDLAKALAQVSDKLQSSVDKDLATLNNNLASSGEQTAKHMQQVADSIAALQTAMGGDTSSLLDKLDTLRAGSDGLGERLSKVLAANNQALADAMQGNRDAMAAQVTTAVTELRDALVGPDGAATTVTAELGRQLQQGQMELAKALARTTESLRNALGEDSGAMLEGLNQLGSGLDAMSESMLGSVGEMGGSLSGDVNQLATTVADAVDDLRMAIVGPDADSGGIVDDLRKAQGDTQKQLQAIHTALKENTQRQIDFSPKGLMTTLEELIKQFNTQFSGQFWEKIGGFNHAIGELIEWMETYRSQLDDMVNMQSRSTKNMDTATRRFDEIASKSEIFIDVSRNISALLGGVDSQRVQIESHLKRFAHIVDETSSALENIEERIVAGNSDMNKHLSDIAERIEEQVIRVDHAMDDELRKALTTFGTQLAALSEKFVEDYTPLTNRLRDVVGIAREM